MKVGKDEGCSVAMQMTSTGGKEGKVRKRSENVRRGFPNRNPRLLAIF